MPRKKKPTAIHLLNGNPSRIKDLGKNEPKPAPVAPSVPEWLSEDAKVEWERISKHLEELGLLTQIDMAALAGYCESYAQWKKAMLFIQKHGEVYPIKDDQGNIKYLQQVPQVSIANKAQHQMRAWCAEFGLTPSARGRISVPGANGNDDPMEELLSGVK